MYRFLNDPPYNGYTERLAKFVTVNVTCDDGIYCRQISVNGPFPRCRDPLFHNESKCKTFLVKITFYYHAHKTHFHKEGLARGLVLRVRVFRTRKWAINKRPFSLSCTEAKKKTKKNKTKKKNKNLTNMDDQTLKTPHSS